jgi:hypothetical protein
MSKKFDLSVKVGKHKDGKHVWRKIGAQIEGPNGPYILLDKTFNPAGVPTDPDKSSIMISMYPPREDEGQMPPQGDVPY